MHRSAALIGIALICCGCARPASRLEPSFSPIIHASSDSVDAMDQDVIRQLKQNGSDVTKPADVVHYLYIPSRRSAEEASRRLASAGYRAAVEKPLGRLPNGALEKRYSVLANETAVPSIEHIRRARLFFEGLARRFGGEYDGWDAAVVR